ncbi:MAG: metal ABC transporter substrate-binding protein [Coriobacteriales bacterium]|jgi:zinc transport system substrate-binding protein|nr:metal ABC transporter substrate-binding protein [Coriobacteriales bacterium]
MNKTTLVKATRRLSRLLLAALLVLLPLAAVGCGGSGPPEQGTSGTSPASGTPDGLVIVASIFAPYDFARTIAGEVAEVSMLVPPGAETHSFEPSPQDIILLNTADVFIYVGGESDAWLEKIVASLDNPGLTLVRMTDLVQTVEEEELEGVVELEEEPGEEAEEEGAGPEIDEHVWTSLRNAETIVSSLANTFSELDSGHAELFQANAEQLNDELGALDTRMTEIVRNAQRSTVVFGDRFPIRYFVDDYGLSYYAAFPGCSTAVDTSPATIAFLVDTVKEQNIPVVFYIELSDQRIARSIAEETGAQTLLFHSVHNISKEDMEAGATYVGLMQANADNLEVALN